MKSRSFFRAGRSSGMSPKAASISSRTRANGTARTRSSKSTARGDKTELRFTHRGPVPAIECYGGCSGAWGYFINESLRDLIATGKGKPETKEEEALVTASR